MGRWQGVFIDFYGTIAGGDALAVQEVCQQLITDHGLSCAACDLAVAWGQRYFACIDGLDGCGFRLLAEIEHDTLVEVVEPLAGRVPVGTYIERFSAYLSRPPVFDEVRPVLEAVRAMGLPICIVSNADERELRAAVEHHALPVDYIVTSESARSYKPEPKIFETALELTGLPRSGVIHVGDSLHSDVGGAHRAGLLAAWVNRQGRIHDIGTEEPDFTWLDLSPLVDLVRGREKP